MSRMINKKRIYKKLNSLEKKYEKLNRVRDGFTSKPSLALARIEELMERLMGRKINPPKFSKPYGYVFPDTSRIPPKAKDIGKK